MMKSKRFAGRNHVAAWPATVGFERYQSSERTTPVGLFPTDAHLDGLGEAVLVKMFQSNQTVAEHT